MPSIGALVLGVCKRCGHEKWHNNALNDSMQWPLTTTAQTAAKKARHTARVGQHERQLYVE